MEKECLFCRIIRGEIPAQVVYEDDEVLAFNDVNPVAPVHILLIPKQHISGVMEISEGNKHLIGSIYRVIRQLAEETGIADDGFRVVVNHGEQAGQSVFHIHFHLLGGRPMKWPPG